MLTSSSSGLTKQSLKTGNRASTVASRSDSSLIPLINIIFLLLIFYMIAGQISYSDGANIDVPVSASEKQLSPSELQLSITADGVITVNGAPLDPSDLNASLADVLGPYPNLTVTIKADKEVRARQLQKLVTALKHSGVNSIALFSKAGEDT